MLRSMTGFGRCLVENSGISQEWEIRSVNSRYLDLKWRLPQLARYLEPGLEKLVRKYAGRGRVEISLQLQFEPGYAPEQNFDAATASSMLDKLANLAQNRGDEFKPDYNRLLEIPSLWFDPRYDLDDNLAIRLEKGLTIALEDWNESRNIEGKKLSLDLQSRILRMEEWTEVFNEKAPEIKENRIQILKDRLIRILEADNISLDENRYLQEVAILTDKLDVSEELTRLFAHLERLQQLLNSGEDAGRRLDFTLQECFREVNTFGNKLPDPRLSGLVVDFKNELEKCREQVQNLE